MKKPSPSIGGVQAAADDLEPLEWLTRALEDERIALGAHLESLKATHSELISQLGVHFRINQSKASFPPDCGPEVPEHETSLANEVHFETDDCRSNGGFCDEAPNCSVEAPWAHSDPPGHGIEGDANGVPDCIPEPNGVPDCIPDVVTEQSFEKRKSIDANKKASLRSRRASTEEPTFPLLSFARLQAIVLSNWFEAIFGMLIVFNSIVICLEAQYSGFETGYAQGFAGYRKDPTQVWPGAETAFWILEMMFGIFFTFEVVLKMIAMNVKFLWQVWNWFDTLIIISWLVTVGGGAELLLNPTILRLARLARLLRMLRLTRTFQVFDVLHLLVGSLKASALVLLWSLVFLTAIMTMNALLLNFMLEMHTSNKGAARAEDVFRYFGTFSRAFLTMFEVTLGNWVPVCRLLLENVSEWFTLYFLLYRSFVGFAVLNVIRGVFLHETFKVAECDEEIMIMQRQRLVRKHMRHMQTFFHEADESGDGVITLDEFSDMVSDARVQLWLSAMGIDITDAPLVFELMDDGDHVIEIDELCKSFARMKGPAKSIDLVTMMHQTRRTFKIIIDMLERSGLQPPRRGSEVARMSTRSKKTQN